jgi:hypothetical protein
MGGGDAHVVEMQEGRGVNGDEIALDRSGRADRAQITRCDDLSFPPEFLKYRCDRAASEPCSNNNHTGHALRLLSNAAGMGGSGFCSPFFYSPARAAEPCSR